MPLRLIEEFLKETLSGKPQNLRKEEDKKQTTVSQVYDWTTESKNCNKKSLQKKLKEKRVTFKRLSQEL